ncbi:hypothetical protein AB0E77_33895 [Streptomyces sp. NPDC032940]|uniref:hypothetical protein n=1 Tax=Streptomyces sp. NPDC032940 TaxID=3155366 RepID=UPI0033F8ADA8
MNAAQGQDAFGGRPPVPPQRGKRKSNGNGNGDDGQGRRPQLPPRGGARAELPGGNPGPRTPSWSDENAQPPVPRASLDAPRGHEEPGSSRTPHFGDQQGPGATAEMPAIPRHGEPQGPGATAEFARPDFDAPAPLRDDPQSTGQFARPAADPYGRDGVNAPHDDQFARPEPAAPRHDGGQFVRQDVFGGQPGHQGPNGAAPAGQFNGAQGYGDGANGQQTGQHRLPGRQDPAATGQFERPQASGTHAAGDFGAPRPPAPQQRPAPQDPGHGTPAQQRPADGWALPPASGPGDGRTPLYDTLETNWFHGDRGAADDNAPAPAAEPQAQPQTPAAPQRPAGAAWRSSPNDDLVRQAERVRQPAAGGVTTSGLPRRVPRANLVPGTAQQQSHQNGPQVSRAPDDVRGRLTNLRRGIAQGRQAGTNQTGSHPRPTHQQER